MHQNMQLVAVVGDHDEIVKWFSQNNLYPDYFLVAENESTRYVGWHTPIPQEQVSDYDHVIFVPEPKTT